jgi:hypothetical protein
MDWHEMGIWLRGESKSGCWDFPFLVPAHSIRIICRVGTRNMREGSKDQLYIAVMRNDCYVRCYRWRTDVDRWI